MPACSAQSTPRPDNFAQVLTQWRYGSWTAVRKQTGFIASYPNRGHYGLEIYQIESEEYINQCGFCVTANKFLFCSIHLCVCVHLEGK